MRPARFGRGRPGTLVVRRGGQVGLGVLLAWAVSCSGASAADPRDTDARPGFERLERPWPFAASADSWWRAWPAWLDSCAAWERHPEQEPAPARAWSELCLASRAVHPRDGAAVRDFLAAAADAYRVLGPEAKRRAAPTASAARGKMTGYYEPVLEGSRTRHEPYVWPVYALPSPIPSAPRAELDAAGTLAGHELVWLKDRLDAFLLDVQGSGRVRLEDGSSLRLGFAGSNGQDYKAIGQVLVQWGALEKGSVSLPAIREWANTHASRLGELLAQNPRRVFFRETTGSPEEEGPTGSLGVALRAGVSVAVDRRFLPLGAILVATTRLPEEAAESTHIVVAQDSGAAIRGAQRLDWFWGSGPGAEARAGLQDAPGTVYLLVPREVDPPVQR